MASKPTILITGVSGNVGLHLLKELGDFQVIGVDIREPGDRSGLFPGNLFRFETIDLAEERSCKQLLDLMRTYRPEAVVHLAFVVDPKRSGLDEKEMWMVNVAGTSRVMEAVAEHNRLVGGIEKFVFPSSAAVYGPAPSVPVEENAPLKAQDLLYAIQQEEADRTVQARAENLRKCKTYILRSHLYGGSNVHNYQLGVLRGIPGGKGRWAKRLRKRGVRLPILLPARGNYLDRKFQFVHVDDVARLIAHIARRKHVDAQLTVLNVAGRGDSVSLRRCAELAGIRVRRLPGAGFCRQAMRLLWNMGISDISPTAFPYVFGSCALATTKLRVFLGEHYRSVIQHTCEEALLESLPAAFRHRAAKLAATKA